VVVGAPGLGGRWMSRREAEAATWIAPSEGSATRDFTQELVQRQTDAAPTPG